MVQRALPEDGSVMLEDLSDDTAILALQGPQAKDVLAVPRGRAWDASDGRLDGALGISAHPGTGYTGEAATKSSCPTVTLRFVRALIEPGHRWARKARDTPASRRDSFSGVDFFGVLGHHRSRGFPRA